MSDEQKQPGDAEAPVAKPDLELDQRQWRRRTFISFGLFALGAAAVKLTFSGISDAAKVNGVQGPLRSVLGFNEGVNTAIKSHRHLAPQFPVAMAKQNFRTNGKAGVQQAIDPATWRLKVMRNNAPLELTLDDLRSLPKTELCFEFKCIEGWSEITHWAGVRFADVAAKYSLGTKSGAAPDPERPDDLYHYAALETPDGGYYVGIDLHSALHPQTILAYEHNGVPLTEAHGAPLRLIIPTKYGVKNLKRIGTLGFSDERPRDYWHERSYDYDCTL